MVQSSRSKVLEESLVPEAMRNSGLFSELIKATKLLHFNELEIAVWSLVLDSFNWNRPEISREIFLYIIAFQAKVSVNK